MESLLGVLPALKMGSRQSLSIARRRLLANELAIPFAIGYGPPLLKYFEEFSRFSRVNDSYVIFKEGSGFRSTDIN